MVTRLLSALALAMLCAGCATTKQNASADFEPPAGQYKLVVMRPDIAVSLLTAGGQLERREDWTNAARENLLNSLRKQQARHGGITEISLASGETVGDDADVLELNRLHEVVGQSIILHKYTPGSSLPTKRGVFDWTLGELATRYGAVSGYDYALFLYARDSFSSGGRVAVQTLGFLGCIVGVCVIPNGGMQQAFASLVDLRTGRLVWFNYLQSPSGDIRTQEGADEMLERLLDRMKAGKGGDHG